MATVPSLENVTVLKGGEESCVIQVKQDVHQSVGNKIIHILNSAICSSSCENGNCSQPGECDCFQGWAGESCDRGTQSKSFA